MRENERFNDHKVAAYIEDVEFLVEFGGLSVREACKRVGIAKSTYEKRLRKT